MQSPACQEPEQRTQLRGCHRHVKSRTFHSLASHCMMSDACSHAVLTQNHARMFACRCRRSLPRTRYQNSGVSDDASQRSSTVCVQGVYIYIYMYIYMCIYIYIRVCIHTYVYTDMQPLLPHRHCKYKLHRHRIGGRRRGRGRAFPGECHRLSQAVCLLHPKRRSKDVSAPASW